MTAGRFAHNFVMCVENYKAPWPSRR